MRPGRHIHSRESDPGTQRTRTAPLWGTLRPRGGRVALKTGRELDSELWAFERPLSIGGVQVGTRMTVLRLEDGALFLHSPVSLDAETRADLDALGRVRFVVAPNKLHHFFVAPYRDAYPDAELWGAPGLAQKRPRIPFHRELEGAAPASWAGELEQLFFAGIPYVNEVVFLHRASRTLLLTDLCMNFAPGGPLLTRLWTRVMGLRGFGVSRLMRALVRDRAAAHRSLERLLSWDFERVTLTHGMVLQRSGKRLLREAWSWLDAAPPQTR